MTKDQVFEFIEDNKHDPDLMRAIRLAADKNVKALNHKAVVALAHKTIDPMASEIACDLASAVIERYPHYAGKINENAWAEDIEKLNRIDRYDWQIIRGVMEWSQEDDFWRQQVRSGANLRKHFDTMLVRIKEQPKRMEFIS